MNMNNQRRTLIILVSAVDAFISGGILLIYFGFLPVDISSLGIQRWAVGLVGGLWFITSIAILAYQLTQTNTSE